MPTRIAVVGADTISSFDWPANEDAQRATRYLIPLMRDGPTAYVDNADVQVMALVVDSQGRVHVCDSENHRVQRIRMD